MPRIEQFTADAPTGSIQTRRASAGDFYPEGAKDFAETIGEIQKSRDEVEYHRVMSDFRLQTLKRGEELSTMDLGNADLPATWEADFKNREKELNIPFSMREQAAQDLDNLRVTFVGGAIQEQARRVGVKAKADWENIVTANANAVALNPGMQAQAMATLEQASKALRIDPVEKEVLLNEAKKTLRGSLAESVIRTRPGAFIQEAKAGKWNDLEDINKYMTAADAQIKSFAAQEKKRLLEGREADFKTKIDNETKFMDVIADQNVSVDQKILKINEMDLKGQVRDEFAVEARRYINSEKEVNAVTNSNVMAGLVTRMYDLNSMAEEKPGDYLSGVAALQQEILAKRADGELSKQDEIKLNQQMKTLMSAKVSDATNDVSVSFGDARSMIQQQLPAEYQGEATRKLFYATEADRIRLEKDKDGKDQLKTIYKNQARTIIDEINQGRRSKTVKTMTSPVTNESDVEGLLKTKGYTMDDVRETAAKYGMTEAQVIDRLRQR